MSRCSISRRRGTVMIYVLVAFTVLMGFCALSVDLARAEAAKTELRRCADACARAAVANLSGGSTAVNNAVNQVMKKNLVDGVTLTINTSDIQYGTWNGKTFTLNATPYNAVKVTAKRTTANNNPIPMIFAGVLGHRTIDVWASSTAAVVTVNSTSTGISANSNPWLAGEPTGTTGSLPDADYPSTDHKWKYDIANPSATSLNRQTDPTSSPAGEPYGSPVLVNFTLQPGDVIEVSNVSGTSENSPGGASHTADGSAGGSIIPYDDQAASPSHNETGDSTGSEHGIANSLNPIDSLLGVFLTNSTPDSTPAPAGLNFSSTSSRNYMSYSPLTKQVFYIGDGQTSTDQQQEIVVPPTATRLFLGIQDGHEWSNNSGGFNATITQYRIELVQ